MVCGQIGGFQMVEIDQPLFQPVVFDAERPARERHHPVIHAVFQQEAQYISANESSGPGNHRSLHLGLVT